MTRPTCPQGPETVARELRVTPKAVDALAVYAALTGQGTQWTLRDLPDGYIGIQLSAAAIQLMEKEVDVDDPVSLSLWLMDAVDEMAK